MNELVVKNDLSLNTNLEIKVNNAESGETLYVEQLHNLVVTAGRNLVRDFLNGDTGLTGLTHVAISSSTSAEAASDTGIGVELYRALLTQKTESVASLNCKYYLSATLANGHTLTKIGLFGNGATTSTGSGTIYAEALHTSISKTTSVTVTYSWDCNQTV